MQLLCDAPFFFAIVVLWSSECYGPREFFGTGHTHVEGSSSKQLGVIQFVRGAPPDWHGMYTDDTRRFVAAAKVKWQKRVREFFSKSIANKSEKKTQK